MNRNNLNHIKAIFTQRTGVVLPTARSALSPLRRGLLAAAAVLCCLSATVLAANHLTGGALVRFFQAGGTDGKAALEDCPGTLSETQLLTIDRYTREVGQVQKVGDTTITLQTVTAAATSHDVMVYCVFSVEAPEGSWTEADNDLLGFTHYYCRLDGDTTQYCSTSWLHCMNSPQDRPNEKTVVATYLLNAQGDNRHLRLRIDLEDFWICRDRQSDWSVISPGVWTFELPLELETGVSLLDAPVDLGGRTLSALELTPLGGSVVVSLPGLPRDQWQPERVVLADGSSVAINLEGGLQDEENGVECLGFLFPVPTDLTDAVAVEFAGGMQVEIS